MPPPRRLRGLETLIAFSVVACAEPTTPPRCTPPAPSAPAAGFVQREGAHLVLDGAPFAFAGANAYQLLPTLQRGRDERAAELLDEAAAWGLSVLRVWAFNTDPDDRNALHTAPGLYNEEGLRALDRLIALAHERGLRLILVLSNHWPDYGGLDTYAAWEGLTSRADAFASPRVRDHLAAFATTLATRRNTTTGRLYRDEPAILGWDLINEPRCEDPGCAPDLTASFTAEVAAQLRQADPNHLIGVGDEGFRNQHGVDSEALAATGAFDWVSIHLWPAHWFDPAAPDPTPAFVAIGRDWIDRGAYTADRYGLPLLIGELGWSNTAATTHGATERAAVFTAWLDRARHHRAAGALAWRLSTAPPDRDHDGYAIHPDHDAQTLDTLCRFASP